MNKNRFLMELPLDGDYMTAVRLATGGVCAVSGFDLDKEEDFKVCITESLLILKRNRFGSARVEFENGNGVRARLTGLEGGGAPLPSVDDGISYALLSALTEQADFIKDGEKVTAIVLSVR